MLTAVDARSYVPPTRITVKEFLLNEWLPAIKGTLRPTTYASYTMLAKEHIIPRLGSLQLQKLTPAADQRPLRPPRRTWPRAWRRSALGLLGAPRARRPAPRLSRRRALGHASQSTRWMPPIRPSRAQSTPSAAGLERASSWPAFSPMSPTIASSALWRLLAMTGMRRGEALGLQWADLDMEAGTISIRRAWIPVNGIPQMSEPKTSRGRRTIALDPTTLEALKAHAARQADEQSDWEEAWIETGFVFTREDGQPLHPWHVSKAFQDHLKAAALPRIPLHSLRHSYATLALSSGVNPRSSRAGWATPPWPSPSTSTRTSCRSRIATPPSASPICCCRPS